MGRECPSIPTRVTARCTARETQRPLIRLCSMVAPATARKRGPVGRPTRPIPRRDPRQEPVGVLGTPHLRHTPAKLRDLPTIFPVLTDVRFLSPPLLVSPRKVSGNRKNARKRRELPVTFRCRLAPPLCSRDGTRMPPGPGAFCRAPESFRGTCARKEERTRASPVRRCRPQTGSLATDAPFAELDGHRLVQTIYVALTIRRPQTPHGRCHANSPLRRQRTFPNATGKQQRLGRVGVATSRP